MNNIPKPEIIPNFTIEDIHKIRAWHYEREKGMTPQEICEDIRKGAKRFLELPVKPIDPAMQEEVDRILQSVRTKKMA